jgi:hypothetical protein
MGVKISFRRRDYHSGRGAEVPSNYNLATLATDDYIKNALRHG